MTSYLHLSAVLLLSLSALNSKAQQEHVDLTGKSLASSKANPKDCYQTFPGDSVELYYNNSYWLTPKACASIRRNTHLSPSGTFSGLVCDYSLADGRLLSRQHYRGGQRNGLYELLHPSGRVVVRGQFENGLPTGIWQYWYANGQARQTLMWGASLEEPFRIIAYWDSTGTQRAKDGSGTWEGIHAGGRNRYGGPIVNGLAQGTWKSTVIRSGQPYCEETYEQGRFVEGFDLYLHKTRRRYPGPAVLLPVVNLPSATAESFALNEPCDKLRAQAEMARRVVRPPEAPGGLNSYNGRLLKMLREQAESDRGLGMKGRITLLVDVGKSGQLTLDETSRDVHYAQPILSMLNHLPQWKPATVDGQPVPGRLTIEMEISSSTVSSYVYPSVKQ